VRAIEKAARVAGETKNQEAFAALQTARAALAEHLVSMGVRLPDRKAKGVVRRREGTEPA